MGLIVIHNAETGETTTREETAEETAQREADAAQWSEAQASMPKMVPKLTIIERMTDAEVEQADTAMATQSAKLRQIWSAANEIWSNSPWFGDLQAFFVALYGQQRTGELLEM